MTYPDATIERETLERMLRTAEPDWTLRTADPLDGGYLATYRLAVETPTGPRECVLKASPYGDGHGVALEPRVLAILREHTSIPVPTVLGVVDAQDDLPAPFFLMEAMGGRTHSKAELGELPEPVHERLARTTGRYLAELHAVEAVEAFGFLRHAADSVLHGGQPGGDAAEIRVVEPADSWRAFLRGSAAGVLDILSDGRFGDLLPDVRSAVEERVDDLSGPFEPALGHIDGSPENVLIDPERGEVTAMLDWAFTLAVTPAYDLTFVVHSFSGGPWWYLPSTPDRNSMVREAVVAGYRERGPERVVEQFRVNRACYELLSTIHSAVNFADRLEFDGATDEEMEDAAGRHRKVLASYC